MSVSNWFILKATPQLSHEFRDLLRYVPDPGERGDKERNIVERELQQETEKLLDASLARWYVRDAGHSRLVVLLRRLNEVHRASTKGVAEPVFLAQAGELEALGAVETPTESQQRRIVELVATFPRHVSLLSARD